MGPGVSVHVPRKAGQPRGHLDRPPPYVRRDPGPAPYEADPVPVPTRAAGRSRAPPSAGAASTRRRIDYRRQRHERCVRRHRGERSPCASIRASSVASKHLPQPHRSAPRRGGQRPRAVGIELRAADSRRMTVELAQRLTVERIPKGAPRSRCRCAGDQRRLRRGVGERQVGWVGVFPSAACTRESRRPRAPPPGCRGRCASLRR